mgnify:CR=1 FL=1
MINYDDIPESEKKTLESLLTLSKRKLRKKFSELKLTDEQYFDFISVLEMFKTEKPKWVKIINIATYLSVAVILIFIILHFHLLHL